MVYLCLPPLVVLWLICITFISFLSNAVMLVRTVTSSSKRGNTVYNCGFKLVKDGKVCVCVCVDPGPVQCMQSVWLDVANAVVCLAWSSPSSWGPFPVVDPPQGISF
eukprot:scaffold244507_cov19-Tisochrysis_lutea.AAC.1